VCAADLLIRETQKCWLAPCRAKGLCTKPPSKRCQIQVKAKSVLGGRGGDAVYNI